MSQALIDAMKAAEEAFLRNARTDLPYGIREGSPPIAPWPTKPCKIAFLDFDGVLNSEQSVKQLGTRYRFARANVNVLNEVLKHTDALLVITSSWRENWNLKEIATFLERDGVVPGRVVGKTRALGGERGIEIDAWLCSVPYVVESFVILDDKDDMAMHLNRFVRINEQIGLTYSEAQRAIELLSIPWRNKL
jgi:hypothetical protein